MRLLHASSALLEVESLRPPHAVPGFDGEVARLLGVGEKAPTLELFIGPGPPNKGRPMAETLDGWKGFAADGTLRRRPWGRISGLYKLCEREWPPVGDAMPEPQRGLERPVEKVADIGVLKSLGDAG